MIVLYLCTNENLVVYGNSYCGKLGKISQKIYLASKITNSVKSSRNEDKEKKTFVFFLKKKGVVICR